MVTLTAAAVCAMAPISARADEPAVVHIRGVVRDAVGRPLEGALVNDGHQTVLTEADGSYDLPERNPGTYTVRVHRHDTLTATFVVDATLPIDRRVDATLLYRIGGLFRDATPVSGETATLDLRVRAPAADAPGLCVVVRDPQAASPFAASYIGPAADGGSSWTVEVPTAVDRPEGFERVEFHAARCVDGLRLTATASAPLYIDRSPPWIDSINAIVGGSAAVEVAARDTGLIPVGIVSTTLAVEIAGVSVPSSYDEDREIVRFTAPASTGQYEVVISVADHSQNIATTVGSLLVDATPPEETSHGPTDEVGSTPRIFSSMVDTTTFVNPGGARMCLSDGQRANFVNAELTPDGELAYEVPTVPTGLRLGESPLANGPYTVHVEAFDAVGNRMSSTWTFTVIADDVTSLSVAVLPSPSSCQ